MQLFQPLAGFLDRNSGADIRNDLRRQARMDVEKSTDLGLDPRRGVSKVCCARISTSASSTPSSIASSYASLIAVGFAVGGKPSSTNGFLRMLKSPPSMGVRGVSDSTSSRWDRYSSAFWGANLMASSKSRSARSRSPFLAHTKALRPYASTYPGASFNVRSKSCSASSYGRRRACSRPC